MGRPRKYPLPEMTAPTPEGDVKEEQPQSDNRFARVVQLYAGLDLIGSKNSINNKTASLEVLPQGILAVSKNNGRKILIPWANVKGCELL